MRSRGLVLLALTASLVAAPPVRSAEETARQILDRRKALDDGARRWVDRQGRLTLMITQPEGDALSSRSQPLDPPTRRVMERRLGNGFGAARYAAFAAKSSVGPG
jgi:hypothetical protein